MACFVKFRQLVSSTIYLRDFDVGAFIHTYGQHFPSDQ